MLLPGWTLQGSKLGTQFTMGRGYTREGPHPGGQPYLCPVWQENGTGQVTSDTTQKVDDGDAVPAGQLLQVPQDGHLEADGHQAVQDPMGRAGGWGVSGEAAPSPSLASHS